MDYGRFEKYCNYIAKLHQYDIDLHIQSVFETISYLFYLLFGSIEIWLQSENLCKWYNLLVKVLVERVEMQRRVYMYIVYTHILGCLQYFTNKC